MSNAFFYSFLERLFKYGKYNFVYQREFNKPLANERFSRNCRLSSIANFKVNIYKTIWKTFIMTIVPFLWF